MGWRNRPRGSLWSGTAPVCARDECARRERGELERQALASYATTARCPIRSPSPVFTTAPYFDVDHTTSKAFNNWGTPSYYVIDKAGRSRFDAVSSAVDALVRAQALRLAE